MVWNRIISRHPVFTRFLLGYLGVAAVGIWIIQETIPTESVDFLSISVQYLAATGTLALAAGTFYNIQLTNKDLRLREQKREKPLAVDELSNVIEPGIHAVAENLDELEEDTFDWVYVDGPSGYGAIGHPSSAMPTKDVAALQRLSQRNRDLYQGLVRHEELIRQMAELGSEIYQMMRPLVIENLREAGYSEEDYTQSEKVFVSAMVKRLDEFGESHKMYDYWNAHGEELIDLMDSEAAELVEELESREEEFEEHCRNLHQGLENYRAEVQREYGISMDEIAQSSASSQYAMFDPAEANR